MVQSAARLCVKRFGITIHVTTLIANAINLLVTELDDVSSAPL